MHAAQDESGPTDRDLTLTERLEWVNSFERSLRREDGSIVLELSVYPLTEDRTLPPPDFPRTFTERMRRFVSGAG